jgi:hypothetical protein
VTISVPLTTGSAGKHFGIHLNLVLPIHLYLASASYLRNPKSRNSGTIARPQILTPRATPLPHKNKKFALNFPPKKPISPLRCASGAPRAQHPMSYRRTYAQSEPIQPSRHRNTNRAAAPANRPAPATDCYKFVTTQAFALHSALITLNPYFQTKPTTPISTPISPLPTPNKPTAPNKPAIHVSQCLTMSQFFDLFPRPNPQNPIAHPAIFLIR